MEYDLILSGFFGAAIITCINAFSLNKERKTLQVEKLKLEIQLLEKGLNE